jgi:hypothetical protein
MAAGGTPGAHSFSRNRPSARWKTARSVYTRVTTRRPVSGNALSLTIFGCPARSTCSITTQTSRAPATRSIAPPTAGFLPGTYQFARSPCAETCRAPSTVTSRWPPRTMANDVAESTIAAPLISVTGCLPASVRSGSSWPGGGAGPGPRTPFSACRTTSAPAGMNRGISSGMPTSRFRAESRNRRFPLRSPWCALTRPKSATMPYSRTCSRPPKSRVSRRAMRSAAAPSAV